MTDAMQAIERAVASVTRPNDRDQIFAALRMVSPAMVDDVVFGVVSSIEGAAADGILLGVGLAASPGVGVGAVVSSSTDALDHWDAGQEVVLVVDETTPADEPAMRVAAAIVARRGGVASHAAIVARQWGVPAVCGIGGIEIADGEVVLVDGSTGEVRLFGDDSPARSDDPRGPLQALPDALAELLAWADRLANTRIAVHANADTAGDAHVARELGAQGIGLCRTEHHFLGERYGLVGQILAGDPEAITEMALLQRTDVLAVLDEFDAGRVVIRLIDAPRHEFEVAHHEHNPMLGMRGVRMAVRHPGILVAQAEAVAHAVADRMGQGAAPDVGVMLPMVSTVEELRWARTQLGDVFFRVGIERGLELDIPIGTMIETPRAALIASSLAQHCDFFSFGTNDLTQLTWGYSRDDLDAELVPLYRDRELLDRSPFETLDGSGVVRLMALAAETGRAQNPQLGLGMCGEHGGDPASIAVAVQLGLTSVSVSPYRVPAARLAAAHAVLGAAPGQGSG